MCFFSLPQIAKRTHHTTSHSNNPSSVFLPNRHTQPQSERLAHEQFIEQNAWARPQWPTPNHGTPNLTHTPDWAESGPATAAKHISRRMLGAAAAAGKSHSEPPDPPAAAATTTAANNQPRDQSTPAAATAASARASVVVSPIAVTKQRAANGERELTGFRNISGLSNASTIDAPSSAEKERDHRPQQQPQQQQQAFDHPFHHHQMTPGFRFAADAHAAKPQPTTSFRPAAVPVAGGANGERKA